MYHLGILRDADGDVNRFLQVTTLRFSGSLLGMLYFCIVNSFYSFVTE
jgi:hypothetical protein